MDISNSFLIEVSSGKEVFKKNKTRWQPAPVFMGFVCWTIFVVHIFVDTVSAFILNVFSIVRPYSQNVWVRLIISYLIFLSFTQLMGWNKILAYFLSHQDCVLQKNLPQNRKYFQSHWLSLMNKIYIIKFIYNYFDFHDYNLQQLE